MMEQREKTEIKRVHDNDKYVVTRTFVDEMNGKRLVQIHKDIQEAIKMHEEQIRAIPKDAEKKIEELTKSLNLLRDRKDAFGEFADKIAPEEAEQDVEPVGGDAPQEKEVCSDGSEPGQDSPDVPSEGEEVKNGEDESGSETDQQGSA